MNARNEYIIRWNNYLISMYGQQVWSRFWRKISEKDTFFQNRLKTTDTMPIEKFLLFMHDVVRFFFDDHTSAYKVIGARDAELALTDSVNVQMLHSRPFERFAEHLFPFLWRKQFDYGSVRGYSLPDAVDVRIAELPLRHPYFEFWTLGFVAKALSLLGACQVCTTCIQSFEKKDSQIQYRFHYQRPKD